MRKQQLIKYLRPKYLHQCSRQDQVKQMLGNFI